MVNACLAARTHYLDINGEVPVFEALAARDQEARIANVTLMPGVGFDVVPSDCLALHLKQKLPSADSLCLAIASSGRTSPGTLRTALEQAPEGTLVRRAGKLERLRLGSRWRTIDLGRGPAAMLCIPWGDVSTAFRTTQIPNIEVYWSPPPGAPSWLARLLPLASTLLAGRAGRALAPHVARLARGPSESERERGSCVVWGEVTDAEGRSARAVLHTPDGYALTAEAAVLAASKLMNKEPGAGCVTPAMAWGSGLVLELGGVTRTDLD
jgi:short subunit dehydrogenase-like uncharacterized protein